MNETNLREMARMLLKERLERAAQARLVRHAMDPRASREKDPPRLEASRKPCRRTEQTAY